jgi:SulP family sulfate permease
VAAPLAKFIPLATLAAVFVVAYNMGEWRGIGTILKLSRADIAVWAATFRLTVFADLTVAVEVGMSLAALLYIYWVPQTTTVAMVTPEYIERGGAHVPPDKDVPGYVSILRIHGLLLFGRRTSWLKRRKTLRDSPLWWCFARVPYDVAELVDPLCMSWPASTKRFLPR